MDENTSFLSSEGTPSPVPIRRYKSPAMRASQKSISPLRGFEIEEEHFDKVTAASGDSVGSSSRGLPFIRKRKSLESPLGKEVTQMFNSLNIGTNDESLQIPVTPKRLRCERDSLELAMGSPRSILKQSNTKMKPRSPSVSPNSSRPKRVQFDARRSLSPARNSSHPTLNSQGGGRTPRRLVTPRRRLTRLCKGERPPAYHNDLDL